MAPSTTHHDDEEHVEVPRTGCGILGRYPVITVLVFAGAGIGIGLGLSAWDPEDPEDKDTALQWIGLIGDMFIRGLKAVVLPLVFVNVILSVVDMMSVGRAGSVGWKTIGLYLLTTLLASIIGLISIVSFKGKFDKGEFDDDTPARVRLACDQEGAYLSHTDTGSVTCAANVTEDESFFFITDVDGKFVSTTSGPKDDISMSETIYDGVFTKLITSNIFDAFVRANFAAVVLFAILFGAALVCAMRKKGVKDEDSVLVKFLKEIDSILLMLINWLILVTPFAVLSLIAKAIGKQDNLSESFENVGWLVAATVIAMACHVILVYIGLFWILTKRSPFAYLQKLLPAQTTAFACASSAATIPVTLKCVKSTGIVPDPIAKFVVPMGATINMDGGAIYFPCACIWLAVLNGENPTFGNYILLIILATVGSAGTAPVPSASLVLIITAYNTVFGTTGTPDGFSFILAIDWLMDRFRTTTNVTGDAVVTGIVASRVSLDDFEEQIEPESEELKKVQDDTVRPDHEESSSSQHSNVMNANADISA